MALKEHFDGPGSNIRLKAAAYAAIKRSEYKDAKNFDYELYRRIHTQAHSDLARYGEPVPETKKVKDFLDWHNRFIFTTRQVYHSRFHSPHAEFP